MNFFHKAILGLSCLTLLGMQACTTKSSAISSHSGVER